MKISLPLLLCAFLLLPAAVSADPLPRCGTFDLPRPEIRPRAAAKQQIARSFSVGDTLTVRAYSFRLGVGGHYYTTTTCRWVGQHCYVFVEDDQWGTRVAQSGVEALAGAFDRATVRYPDRGIFSVNTQVFGHPPDVDGDARILIVALDIEDSPITGSTYVGYFDVENQAPPISREILYIDSKPLDISSGLAAATLSHEFQHMIHWRADPDEDKWVDEGCSEYAELACGYKDTTEAAAWAFLQQISNTSLTEWEDQAYDFDQAFLWTAYFAERYGEDAVRALVSDPENGIPSVDRILASLDVPERFEDLFADWTAAVYLDGPGKWGYSRLNLAPVVRDTVAVPTLQGNRKAMLWGTDYLDLGDASGISIAIGGSGDNGLLAVLITQRDDGPSATAFSITPGATQRIRAFGRETRALAVSRTSGQTPDYAFSIAILDGASPTASDFDGSGLVDFEDFLRFVIHYGRAAGSTGYDPTCDLDGDRQIGFPDFLIFARNYGARP